MSDIVGVSDIAVGMFNAHGNDGLDTIFCMCSTRFLSSELSTVLLAGASASSDLRTTISRSSAAFLAAISASILALRSASAFLRSASSAADLSSSNLFCACLAASRIAAIHCSAPRGVSALSLSASADNVVSGHSVNLPFWWGTTAESSRLNTSACWMLAGFLSGPAEHQ